MTTKEFNKGRADEWLERMTKDEARLWMMVGMKENGAYTFMVDAGLTQEGIAQRLENMAKAIRTKNSNTN